MCVGVSVCVSWLFIMCVMLYVVYGMCAEYDCVCYVYIFCVVCVICALNVVLCMYDVCEYVLF